MNVMVQTRPGLTIVTPSFEKHFVHFRGMLESLSHFCEDPEFLELVVVVERGNRDRFAELCRAYPRIPCRILLTEDILRDFGILETPAAFLKRIGKFTFQTLKKFGALARARAPWSLVMDSEGLFHKPFSARRLLSDYAEQKYVFYTETQSRGPLWRESTGFQVTANCGAALQVTAGDRWYMEYFHWFYETDKVVDLIQRRLGATFFARIRDRESGPIDYFENVLYYIYIQQFHSHEYNFYDFKELVDEYLPPAISARFKLDELPFSLFGNEYILNILAPGEVQALAPLFERFRLPFARLEPPLFSTGYIPALKRLDSFVATISSHHAVWLNKKIAVCISGEFRHAVHRVPEQHVRHLLGFLSGVECDIYLHGWSNPSEALIVEELQPRAYKFEPRPDFSSLLERLQIPEPNIKPGRDAGSLSMFYGMREAFRLIEPNIDEYDYVLRIRPDLYSDFSLKEILVRISDEGDLLEKTIYMPKHFHSKGVNDQIAIGPTEQMSVYFRTIDYVREQMESLFFNPEAVLLRNLVEKGVELAIVDIPYALMRNEPIRIGSISENFQRQFGVWWSRTDDLPLYEPLSDYFADKLASMDASMRGLLPDLMFLRGPAAGGGHAAVRLQAIDNDPVRRSEAMFNRFGFCVWSSYVLEDGEIVQTSEPVAKQVFVYPAEGDRITLAEWRWRKGRFVAERLTVDAADASPAAFPAADPPERAVAVASDASSRAPTLDAAAGVGGVAGQLWTNARLLPGARLRSNNEAWELRLDLDGELVLAETRHGPVVWRSGARGSPTMLLMQGDGNLVIYDPQGGAIWSSGTCGRLGAYLDLRDNGVLALTDGRDDFWARPQTQEAEAAVAAFGAGATLSTGDRLISSGGEYALYTQHDGNLVLYRLHEGEPAEPVWASGTAGEGAHLQLSHEGVLRLEAQSGDELWRAPGSAGPEGRLELTGSGELRLRGRQGVVWRSAGGELADASAEGALAEAELVAV